MNAILYKILRNIWIFKKLTNKYSTYYIQEVLLNVDEDVIRVSHSLRGYIELTYSETSTKYFDIPECLILTRLKNINSSGNLSLPDSIEGLKILVVDDNAFYLWHKLMSVQLPSSLLLVGANAFKNCINLRSVIFPKSVTFIGPSAFANCTNLTSCTFPNSVNIIGPSVFSGCSNLSSVTLPENITCIATSSFRGCRSLDSITIPMSVNNIGYEAFEGCSALKHITIKAKNPPYANIACIPNISSISIKVPQESIDAYKQAKFWSGFSNQISGF